MITERLLVESGTCEPLMAEKWVVAVGATCRRFEVDTPERVAGFLSQVGHESGGFRYTSENLNYSPARLMQVFPKYFPNESLANAYGRQPEKIANRVYANRMGNGDETSGDGWRFRGRGLIQLTGKENYLAFMMEADNMALLEPDSVAVLPSLAADCAGWYWRKYGLNALADKRDVVGMTRRINGGTNGLDDRQMRYARLIQYFQANP
jgi:putative chitinase